MVGFSLAGIIDPARVARFGFTIQAMIISAGVIFTAFLGGMAMQDLTLALAIAFSLIASIASGWYEALSISGAPLELDPKDIGMANGAQYSLRTICASIASKSILHLQGAEIAANAIIGAIYVTTVGLTCPILKYCPH